MGRKLPSELLKFVDQLHLFFLLVKASVCRGSKDKDGSTPASLKSILKVTCLQKSTGCLCGLGLTAHPLFHLRGDVSGIEST